MYKIAIIMEFFTVYLQNVDSIPADEKVIQEVVETPAANSVTAHHALEGLSDAHIDKAFEGKGIGATALAKRARWAVNTASQIKRQNLIDESGGQHVRLPKPCRHINCLRRKCSRSPIFLASTSRLPPLRSFWLSLISMWTSQLCWLLPAWKVLNFIFIHKSAFGSSLRRRIGLRPNLDVKRSATST